MGCRIKMVGVASLLPLTFQDVPVSAFLSCAMVPHPATSAALGTLLNLCGILKTSRLRLRGLLAEGLFAES